MGYKNRTKVFLTIVILVIIAFFAMLIYYDPLKLFHKPWIYKQYMQKSMREQAAGLLNHWKYDSIILGSSMLENTSSKEASEVLGGTFINISASGSDYKERSIMLDYAIYKQPNLKRVIYSLDNLGWSREGHPSINIKYWAYLYDKSILNNFKIYMNERYLSCIFSMSSKKKCMGYKVDFDRPKAWLKIAYEAKKFGGLENWFSSNDMQIKRTLRTILSTIKNIDNQQMQTLKGHELQVVKSMKYLDDYIVQFADKYPNIEFLYILPPYSRAKMATIAQQRKADFKVYKESLRYIVSKSEAYKNLKVFAWGEEAFLDDIANYKDLKHYSYKLNSWMIYSIKDNYGLLNADNIESYLGIVTDKALNYDLNIIGDKIKTFLGLDRVK